MEALSVLICVAIVIWLLVENATPKVRDKKVENGNNYFWGWCGPCLGTGKTNDHGENKTCWACKGEKMMWHGPHDGESVSESTWVSQGFGGKKVFVFGSLEQLNPTPLTKDDYPDRAKEDRCVNNHWIRSTHKDGFDVWKCSVCNKRRDLHH